MSLRRATITLLAALLTAMGLAGGVTAYWSALAEASEFQDLQQRQIARYVGDLPTVAPEAAGLPLHDPEDDYAIEVTYLDGRAPLRSRTDVVVPDAATTGFTEFQDAVGQWRVFTLVSPGRTVQIAQQLAVREELATDAALRAALPFVLAIPLAWLIVELVVRRLFRRVEDTAAEVAQRASDDLSPLPSEHLPVEIRPLVDELNHLLARLSNSLDRQRTFLADAAHELRTPIAALTLQIENLRTALGKPEAASRLEELQLGARRIASLASQLLRIARYDATEAGGAIGAVRLDDLMREVIAGLLPLADVRAVDLGLSMPRIEVVGAEAEFRVLLEILVDNAVRYASPGGIVDVEANETTRGIVLTIRDDGAGVPDDILPRLGERFFRGARSDGEGSGLGLAIAKAIASRHHIQIQFANREDVPGFAVTAVFRRFVAKKEAALSPGRVTP